jgi:hypothetical protein
VNSRQTKQCTKNTATNRDKLNPDYCCTQHCLIMYSHQRTLSTANCCGSVICQTLGTEHRHTDLQAYRPIIDRFLYEDNSKKCQH